MYFILELKRMKFILYVCNFYAFKIVGQNFNQRTVVGRFFNQMFQKLCQYVKSLSVTYLFIYA